MPQATEQPTGDSEAAGIYTLDDAVNNLMDTPYEDDSEAYDEPEVEEEVEEEVEDEEGDEDSSEDDQDSDEEQPEDSDEEQPEAADTDLPNDDLVIAEDGDVKVTLGELREQYQTALVERESLQSEFTKKSQHVAEETKKAEAQTEQALAHYQMLMGSLGQSLQQIDQTTDWNGLKSSDPGEFQTRLQQRNQIEQQIQSFGQGAEQLLSDAKAQKAEADKQKATAALDYLKTKVNGWNQDVYSKVASFAESQGLTSDDFYGIRDGAVIKVFHDLMRSQESREKALSKVQGKTQPEAKQKAQKRDKRTPNQRKISKLKARVANGDRAAAVEWLMAQPYE